MTGDVDDADAAPVVRTRGLARSFNRRPAVDGIDLNVPQGAVFGFLGPNGSGKTTTIRLLLGLLRADAGQVELFGQPMPHAAASVLPRVGALVEGPAFYPYLTASANLARLQAFDKTCDPRTARHDRMLALERVGLAAAAGKRFRHYSLGMKQRLGIAAALLRRRDLLILDEPTNGLDPQGTREIRELIRTLHADGTTVIVSSHLLSEVEQVCTHVGIMSRGRLIAQQPLSQLREATAPRLRVDVTPETAGAARAALVGLGLLADESPASNGRAADGLPTPQSTGSTSQGARTVPTDAKRGDPLQTPAIDPLSRPTEVVPAARIAGADDVTSWLVNAGADQVPDVVRALVAAGADVTGVAMERPALEDIFVDLTGAGFDVAG